MGRVRSAPGYGRPVGDTITVLSQKGGTGKTTMVRTLADVFRRAGIWTCSWPISTPRETSPTTSTCPPDASPTVADVLAGQAKAADAYLRRRAARQPRARRGRARARAARWAASSTLKRALRELRKDYDLILIDCPPALGLLTVNALVAADHALISSEAEYFSLQGVEQALEVVELAKESLHPDLDWLGVVLNIADMRLVHAREAQAQLRERFGEKLFDTVIRRSVRYAESAERGVSILDYAPALGDDYVRPCRRDPRAARWLRGRRGPAGAARSWDSSGCSAPISWPKGLRFDDLTRRWATGW